MTFRSSTWLLGLLVITRTFAVLGADATFDSEIKTAVVDDPVLLSNNIGLVKVRGKPYLVAVGVGLLADQSPKSLIRARRISKLRAEEGFTRFVNGETVTTDTTLQVSNTTQQVNGQTRVASLDVFHDFQRAYAQGYLPPMNTIEAWQFDEHTLFYVIYVALPQTHPPTP